MTITKTNSPAPLRIIDVLAFLIANGPGRTERELAQAIFGDAGYQQRVNQDCSLLLQYEQIKCKGNGGPNDPFTYWPVS